VYSLDWPTFQVFERVLIGYFTNVDSFMIVDCGGGTVDLTTRQLLAGDTLGEITERTGDFCGSSYVDREFIKFLERKVGKSAIEILRNNHYRQMQYLIQEFCKRVKLPFTGDDDSEISEIDIEGKTMYLYLKSKAQNIKFIFNTVI
jgi:hypothetical protein